MKKYFDIENGDIITLQQLKDEYKEYKYDIELSNGAKTFKASLQYLIDDGVLFEISKKYVIIDTIKNGDEFIEILKESTKKDALKRAKNEFDALSDFDKKRRESYFLTKTDVYNDNTIEYDCSPIWSAK